MKSLTTAILILALLALGCQTTAPIAPPLGCEGAWVYKVPGFLPYGPAVVRTAAATVYAVKPELRPKFREAGILGWRLLGQNNLTGALATLQACFNLAPSYVLPGIILVDAMVEAGNKPLALNDCDANVLKSLFRNIATDAGATAADFELPLAGAGGALLDPSAGRLALHIN